MSQSAICVISAVLVAAGIASCQAPVTTSSAQAGANSAVSGSVRASAVAQPSLSLLPLKAVRSIYVEPMSNGLDWYLTQEITRQLAGRVVATKTKETADAVLVANNPMGQHDTGSGRVQLIGSDGSTVLWSNDVGDRSAWSAGMVHGGSKKVASRLVHNLRKAMN